MAKKQVEVDLEQLRTCVASLDMIGVKSLSESASLKKNVAAQILYFTTQHIVSLLTADQFLEAKKATELLDPLELRQKVIECICVDQQERAMRIAVNEPTVQFERRQTTETGQEKFALLSMNRKKELLFSERVLPYICRSEGHPVYSQIMRSQMAILCVLCDAQKALSATQLEIRTKYNQSTIRAVGPYLVKMTQGLPFRVESTVHRARKEYRFADESA